MKTCNDCRLGEHDNYDDDVHLTVVRDSDTNKIQTRANLCASHRTLYEDDGYKLYINGRLMNEE